MQKRILAMLGACMTVIFSLSAATVDVSPRVSDAINKTYDTMAQHDATDQLNNDFIEVYNGLKKGTNKFSDQCYKSALDNAIKVNSERNLSRTTENAKKTNVRADAVLNFLNGSCGTCGAGCKNCHIIRECDFLTQGTISATVVIDQPGQYCLGEDIHYNPQAEESVAFIIDADDVTLDLCGHTLSDVNPELLVVVGIDIEPGHRNIKILNGTITGFTAAAISAIVPDPERALDTLLFEDLTIIDNGLNGVQNDDALAAGYRASGINLESLFNDFPLFETRFGFFNVTINSCFINRSTRLGVGIIAANGLVLEDTQTNETFLNVGDRLVGAYYFDFCKNIKMRNCTGNNTSHNDVAGLFNQVGGAFIFDSENVLLEDCQFNNSFGVANLIVNGANLSNNRNALYINCQFNNPTGGEFSLIVNGVHQSDGPPQEYDANGIKYVNCQFNGAFRAADGGTFAPPFAVVGGTLMITTKNLVFEGCQSTNNRSDNPEYRVFGFYTASDAADPANSEFGATRNFTWQNCVVGDLSGPNDVFGYSHFTESASNDGVAAETGNAVFETCIAEHLRCTSTTGNVSGIRIGLSYNEFLVFGRNEPFHVLTNPYVKNCRISDIKGGSQDSAGIYFESVHNPVILNTSITDCPNGIVFTGSKLINPSSTFQLARTEADAESVPPVVIDLTSVPASTPQQTFKNKSQHNQVDISPSSSTVNINANTIIAPVDLNTLKWELGDTIEYFSNGGANIGGLINGTKYKLVVYVPGFTESGLVQDNYITNCRYTGIRDDRHHTSSIFITNTAYNNGPCPDDNYRILWAGKPPVCTGTTRHYPVCERPFNLSMHKKTHENCKSQSS